MSSATSSGRTSARSDRDELTWIAAFAAIAVAARVVRLDGPARSIVLHGHELPALCPIRALTGRPCPSCGMTRGFLYMMRRDVRNAGRANRLAPLAFAALVARTLVALRRLSAAGGTRTHKPLRAAAFETASFTNLDTAACGPSERF